MKAAYGFVDPKNVHPNPPRSVFLCTSQTFKNAVDQGFVHLPLRGFHDILTTQQIWVNLLVFDECHHCHGDSPYAALLELDSIRLSIEPQNDCVESESTRGGSLRMRRGLRLVGLTATPGVYTNGSVASNLSALERRFGGYIFTWEQLWKHTRALPIVGSYAPLSKDRGGQIKTSSKVCKVSLDWLDTVI